MFERLEGRSNDSIATPDGRLINSLAMVYPLREVEGIERYQIIQKSLDWFHVRLIRNSKYPGDAERRISSAWEYLFRCRLQVDFEYVSTLGSGTSGKFRHVISEIAAEHRASDLASPAARH